MSILQFKTGRSRTLTLTKTVNFPFEFGIDSQLVPAGSSGSSQISAFPNANDPSFQFIAKIGVNGPKGPLAGVAQYTLTATTQLPGGALQTSTDPVGAVPAGPIAYGSGTVNATITLSIPTEEWCEVALFTDLYTVAPLPYIINDGRAFPDYSSIYPGYCGAGFPDGLAANSIRFYEQTVLGTDIEISATNGGAVSSQSYAVTAPFPVDYVINDTDSYGSATRAHSTSPLTYIYSSSSGSLTSATSWSGVQFAGSSTLTNSNFGGTVNMSDINGHTISTSALAGGNFATSASGTISEGWAPPITYALNLNSVAINGSPIGETYDWATGANRTPPVSQITASGQTGATSVLRRQGGSFQQSFYYEAIGGANATQPYSFNLPVFAEWQPQRIFLDKTSLGQ